MRVRSRCLILIISQASPRAIVRILRSIGGMLPVLAIGAPALVSWARAARWPYAAAGAALYVHIIAGGLMLSDWVLAQAPALRG